MNVRTYIRGLSLVWITLCVALLPQTGSSHALASTALEIKGTVIAITSDSLSITATGGQVITFRLTATTAYEKDGQPAQQVDVHVGLHTANAVRFYPKAYMTHSPGSGCGANGLPAPHCGTSGRSRE